MQAPFQECDLGFTFKTPEVLVFFGNAKATLVEIEKKFSSIHFAKVKQTHSDIFIQASSGVVEADAHWTMEKHKGLLIATADCTPIMIYNKRSKKIAAIHAGWRGVENKITEKTLRFLSDANATADDFQIWLGPHILQKSFEVQNDVLQLLLNSSYEKEKSVHFKKTDSGFLVDLQGIIKSQISNVHANIPSIFSVAVDTKIDARFHSYRRDKANAGRNLSFIAKI